MSQKTKKKQNVFKALTPEETTLLQDMQSTLSQILSLQEAPAEEAPEMTEVELSQVLSKMDGEDKPEDEEEAQKAEEPAEVANNPAEERMEPSTEVNDENLSAVAKMLLLLAKKSQPIHKSAVQPDALSVNVITQAIAKALSPVVQKIEQIEKFNENILDAIGVTDEVTKSFQPVKKAAVPAQATDATAVVNELVSVLKSQIGQQKKESQTYSPVPDPVGMQSARKNLADAMPFLFKKALAGNRK